MQQWRAFTRGRPARWMGACLLAAVVGGTAFATRGTDGAGAYQQPESVSWVASCIAGSGRTFTEPRVGSLVQQVVSPDQAIDAVNAWDFPGIDLRSRYPIKYALGEMTNMGHHVGDENSPLMHQNRLVWAVVVGGQEIYPANGSSTQADDPSIAHSSAIYWVDATRLVTVGTAGQQQAVVLSAVSTGAGGCGSF